MVIDLSGVSFCAAGALRILLRFTGDARRSGVRAAVVAGHRTVLRPVQLLKLEPALPLHRRLSDALAWLGILTVVPEPRTPHPGPTGAVVPGT
jgi:anti-anti-sigma regulatory factor